MYRNHSPHKTQAGAPQGAPAHDRKWSRGVTVVEMSLVMSMMIVLSFGVIEIGTVYNTWLTMQKAAQVAARFASTGQGELEGDRLNRIIVEARSMLATLDLDKVEIHVRSWDGVDKSGVREGDPGEPCDTVEVEIIYDYALVSPTNFNLDGFFLEKDGFLPSSFDLTASDRKINEPWQPCL